MGIETSATGDAAVIDAVELPRTVWELKPGWLRRCVRARVVELPRTVWELKPHISCLQLLLMYC